MWPQNDERRIGQSVLLTDKPAILVIHDRTKGRGSTACRSSHHRAAGRPAAITGSIDLGNRVASKAEVALHHDLRLRLLGRQLIHCERPPAAGSGSLSGARSSRHAPLAGFNTLSQERFRSRGEAASDHISSNKLTQLTMRGPDCARSIWNVNQIPQATQHLDRGRAEVSDSTRTKLSP